MKRLFTSRLSPWLGDPPIQDSVERQIASLLQFILIGLMAVVILATVVLMTLPTLFAQEKINALRGNLFGFLLVALPLALLRRGYFRGPLLFIIITLLLTPTLAITVVFDLLKSDGILFQFTLAIILAGLLLSRGILAITFGTSAVVVGFSAFLGGRAAPQLLMDNVTMAINFILFNGLIALFLDRFGITLRTALTDALEREVELQSEIAERKQAEEKILWSEERYRALVEQAGDGIFITNTTGKYVEVNRAGCAMLGYSLEELQGKFINDLIPDVDRAQTPPRLDELRSGKTIISERQLICKGGSLLPVEITARMLSDGRMLGMVRDITERKQTREALQRAHDELEIQVQERTAALSQANNLLQTLMDNVPDHIFFKDLNGRFIRNSRSQTIMLGLHDPAEVTGRSDFDFFPHAQQAYEDEQQIIRSGQPRVDFEEFVVWPTGQETWVSTTKMPLRDQRGRVIGTFGIARDITDRKRAAEELSKAKAGLEIMVEERTAELQHINTQLRLELAERKKVEESLRESEMRIHLILDTALDAIVTIDSESRIVDWNPQGEAVFGWQTQEAIGQMLYDLVIPVQYREAHKQGLRHFLNTGEGPVLNKHIELSALHRNGHEFPIELEIAPLELGKEILFTAFVRDVTTRKLVEAEREKLIEELTAKNAELERFTYTVSHDMKSPLVTIKGFLGYIEEDAMHGNLERLKSDSKRIANAVDKMGQLLDDLLELSRIGRFINPPESIAFEELAHQAIELVQGRIQEHGIVINLQPNLPVVHVDKSRLVEALQNLLDNAAKYIGDQIEPCIEIGQSGEENDMPIFYIKDNGIGIKPEYRERIFGLFDKLDALSEGTGIGLALVKRIIEFHGGRIWVESAEGKGSTFYFTLPPFGTAKPDSVI